MAESKAEAASINPGAAALAWRTLRILGRHFWLKSIGTTAFMLVFFAAYFYLLRHPDGHVTTMPLLALDRWIGFQPWALPIYLSLWVYVSLPPALMSSRSEIVGFGLRIGALCLIGLAVFYLWPTKVPPWSIDLARHPDFAALKGLDAGGNACPSLHVATAVFSAFWLDWMAPGLGFGARMRRLNMLWCLAIAYSTMAVKQHVAVDVFSGAALGAAVAWITRPRGFRRSAANADERAKVIAP
nr:phosphatase PAP2 family protein [Thiomonas sp.]